MRHEQIKIPDISGSLLAPNIGALLSHIEFVQSNYALLNRCARFKVLNRDFQPPLLDFRFAAPASA